MKHAKTLTLIVVLTATTLITSTFCAKAQSEKYLNLGGVGTGLYGSIEFPIGKAIKVGPQISTDWDLDNLVLAAKGNYYFDNIFGLNAAWDAYLGGNFGWRVDFDNNDNSDINWGAQIGGRWFWSEKWGINAEFGGGSGVTGGVGVTMKM